MKMTNRERRDAQLAYISDDSVFEEQIVCRKLLQKLNFMDRSDFDGIGQIVKELLGKSEGAFINPPFYCDYGKHIEVGKNFFANYNCTLLDVARIKIGDNCQMAPNVAIYTAGHPIHPVTRSSAYEYGKEVNGKWHKPPGRDGDGKEYADQYAYDKAGRQQMHGFQRTGVEQGERDARHAENIHLTEEFA